MTRETRFPVAKNELYFYDERTGSSKPMADSDGMLPIQSIQKKWKDSFTVPNNALNTDNWETIQTGSGHAVSVTGGELVITSGTTINTETILQTKETFSDPFRAMFAFRANQKIANTEMYLEAVSVDPVTGVADGLHSVAWRISGSDNTTTTNAVYLTQNGGLTPLASSSQNISNAVTSTNILELELFADEVWYHSRALDSASGRNVSYVRHQQIPDPNAIFKIRIRVKNLGTAPASSTQYNFQFVTVVDYAELTAEITAGRGNTSAGQGIYATVGGTVGTVMSNAIYTDTTTNLTANQLYTGGSRDAGTSPQYNRFRVTVAHTAGTGHGHLYIQQSTDGTTWRETHRVPAPSDGNYRTFEFPINMRYIRVMFQNGATAQTQMFLGSMMVRIDGAFDMDKTISFVGSTTNLTASTTFTGVTLNLGSNNSFNRHRAYAYASHDGTLYMEQSRDGSTWRATGSIPLTAGQIVQLEDLIVTQYVRVRYVNGATTQTSFELVHALVRQ